MSFLRTTINKIYKINNGYLGFCILQLIIKVTISSIDHFTVVGKVTWPLTGSEAGVDLVLIQTSLLLLCKSSCSHVN